MSVLPIQGIYSTPLLIINIINIQFASGIEPIFEQAPNTSVFSILLATSRIRIEKEAEAFPFDSFVADCGGILGLFVGFNFLMIWDLLHFIRSYFGKFIKILTHRG